MFTPKKRRYVATYNVAGRIKIPRDFLTTIVGSCAMITGLLRHITGDLPWGLGYLFFGAMAATLLLVRGHVNWNGLAVFILISAGMMLAGMSSYSTEGLRLFFYFLVMLSGFCIARLMLVQLELDRVGLISLAVVSGIILFWPLFSNFHGNPYDSLFENASRNRLGAYLVITSIATSVGYYSRYGIIPLYPAITAAILSVPLLGRSSILLSFAFLFVSIVMRNDRLSYFLASLSTGGLLLLFLWFNGLSFLVENTNLSRGLETPRSSMNLDYIYSMDLYGFIFGVTLSDVAAIVEYGGNPHNSLVLLHSIFGLFSILILVFYFLKVHNFFRKSVFLMACAILILSRISLDTVAFGDYLDHLVLSVFMTYAASAGNHAHSRCRHSKFGTRRGKRDIAHMSE